MWSQYHKGVYKKGSTYLDFDREWDLDSERLEARDGLGDTDLLSDFNRAGLPRSDLVGERDPYCHSSMLKNILMEIYIYIFKHINTIKHRIVEYVADIQYSCLKCTAYVLWKKRLVILCQ